MARLLRLQKVNQPLQGLGRANPSGETETEPELPELPEIRHSNPKVRSARSDSSVSFSSDVMPRTSSIKFASPQVTVPEPRKARPASMHDLTHRFFRKPAVVLAKLDIFR